MSVEWEWFFSLILAKSSKLVPPYRWPYSIPIWAKTPGHDLGADAPVDRRHRPVPARRGEGARVLLAAAAGEQPGAGELLHPEGQAHVGLAGLDRHAGHPERGGAGGAGIGHVVHRNAGLAQLLLQLLADAGVGRHQVAGADHPHVLHLDAAVGQGAEHGLGGQVDQVQVRVLAELRHVDAQDPQVVGCHAAQPPRGSNPNPIASVPLSSVPMTCVASCTFMPRVTCSGSGSTLIRFARTLVPPQSTRAAT